MDTTAGRWQVAAARDTNVTAEYFEIGNKNGSDQLHDAILGLIDGDQRPQPIGAAACVILGQAWGYLQFGLDAARMRRRINKMVAAGELTATQADRILGKTAAATPRS
jgi:hypothetical protein